MDIRSGLRPISADLENQKRWGDAMDSKAVKEASSLLIGARRTGQLLPSLPESCRPSSIADGLPIQDALVAQLGEPIAGWKAALPPNQGVLYGAMLQSVVFPSPARLPKSIGQPAGVEGEIAFRFERDLPASGRDYTREEVADAVSVMAAIEIVCSRYRDYKAVSAGERAADLNINGAFIPGAAVSDWRRLDISSLEVKFVVDGVTKVQRIGGHPFGDPLAPAVGLVNVLRTKNGVRAGQMMTTGACSGNHYVEPGRKVVVTFSSLGSVEVQLHE